MNIKQFLKPNRGKILITVILSIILFLYLYSLFTIVVFCPLTRSATKNLCDSYYSLPWEGWGPCSKSYCGKPDLLTSVMITIYPLIFIGELMFLIAALYVVSCLLIWIYDKVKKK